MGMVMMAKCVWWLAGCPRTRRASVLCFEDVALCTTLLVRIKKLRYIAVQTTNAMRRHGIYGIENVKVKIYISVQITSEKKGGHGIYGPLNIVYLYLRIKK